jgi:predicted nucleic acid-binding protein
MSVVVDANVTLALVLPLPYSRLASQLWRRWESQDEKMFAPGLWGYEVVSGLRKAEVLRQMLRSDVDEALEVILALNVRLVPASQELHMLAFEWARRLEQTTVYDAQYLALAEALGCPLWTADGRLARTALQYVDWVELLSE